MSNIERVIKGSKRIEQALESLGAEGRGLHEKLTSVEDKLDAKTINTVRWLATVRNKTVHEANFEAEDISSYEAACNTVIAKLMAIQESKTSINTNHNKSSSQGTRNESMPQFVNDEPVSRGIEAEACSGHKYTQTSSGAFRYTESKSPNSWILKRVLLAISVYIFALAIGWLPIPFEIDSDRKPVSSVKRNDSTVSKAVDGSKYQGGNNIAAAADNTNRADSHQTDSHTSSETSRATPSQQAIPKAQIILSPGALVNSATLNTESFEQAKADIQQNVVNRIKESIEVDIIRVEVIKETDSSANIYAEVEWSIPDSQAITDTLNKYFNGYNGRNLDAGNVDFTDHLGQKTSGIKIKKYYNSEENVKLPFSQKLYEFLVDFHVVLAINASGYTGDITIASGRSCSVSCRGQGNSQFQIHYSNLKNKNVLMLNGDSNPILIKEVPSSRLSSIDALQVEVKISHPSSESSMKVVKKQVLKQGELLKLSSQAENQLEEGKQAIDLALKGIVENTNIELGDLFVLEDKEGLVDIKIPVSWQSPEAQMVQTLATYFHSYKGSKITSGMVDFTDHMGPKNWGVVVKRNHNVGDRAKSAVSDELYHYMVKKKLKLIVFADQYQSAITLASGKSCHVSCRGEGESVFQVHFRGGPEQRGGIFRHIEQNPIIISGIPKDELGNIQTVRAEVQLTN